MQRLGLREGGVPTRELRGWATPRKVVTIGGEQWAAWVRAALPNVEVIGVADTTAAAAVIQGADVFVGQCASQVIRAGTSLKWIQLPMAGAESCSAQPLLAERGVVVTNMQALFGPQIAEHVMAMVLSFARQLHRYNEEQRSGQWSHRPADPAAVMALGMWELESKVMLIVGLGGIGTEVAKRAHAFGMRILATRNSGREGPDFVEYVGLAHEADSLAAFADVVVNAAPLTAETRGMFNARFFGAMKRGAYFINVGRGEAVVTDDLVNALRSGTLRGAGLDVTNPEPLPVGHPLWRMPNAIITPHSAAGSDYVFGRFAVLLQENLRRYARGDRLLSVVDLRRGY